MAAERDVERGLPPDMESPKSQIISRSDVGCGGGGGWSLQYAPYLELRPGSQSVTVQKLPVTA